MNQSAMLVRSGFLRGRLRSAPWMALGILFFGNFVSAAEDTAAKKFEFGDHKLHTDAVLVAPTDTYSPDRGYGFEPGTKDLSVDVAGFITSHQPFYFSVAVPPGNYKVTVSLGDPAGESDTTIKAELRRLMLQDVRTTAGKIERRSFIVNVRIPDYPGGKVHLKAPRESVVEAWAWDERLTLEFNGKRPCIDSLDIEKVEVPTVFLLGDSTVCDQPGEPYASWGQMLPRFFKADIAVANHGESGETLKSSTQAHRFDKVLSLIKPGDYLLIQYGHNDMKSKEPGAAQTYKTTLKKWVEAVKQKGGSPVLITSMNRHTFQGTTVTNSLGEYPEMVRESAKEDSVPLLDLNAMSKQLYETLGPDPSIALFEHEPGAKKFDATHHSPYGAYELARCVIQGIRDAKLPLADHIAEDVAEFDPAKPDQENQIVIPRSPAVTHQRPLGD